MNIVSKLTLRHIMGHKRRSLLTVMAIIVSVAMVTAVFTSIFSFLRFLLNSTIAYDGSWHAQLQYNAKPDTAQFTSDEYEFYMNSALCEMRYDKDVTTDKGRTQIDVADPGVIEMRSIKILEGKFPEKENELLITKKYIERNKLTWKLGDTVRVYCEAGDGNGERKGEYREFVICAIAEGNVSFFDYRNGIVAITGRNAQTNYNWNVNVRYKNLDKGIYKKVDALVKNTGAFNQRYNSELLNFSGLMSDGVKTALTSFVAVLLIVIVAASVIMIYDSFAVSYQERERYLGMLASVGATRRQKRFSIYFEGLILAAIGIPLGILSGIAGMAVTFKCIEKDFLSTVSIPIQDTLKVHINIWVVIGTVLVSALTIFISCYIPARRASKTSPIAAIKGTNTVKVKKAGKLRVSGLTKKLYGYEGELAVKNFKRNGRRSRTIIFALVVSVVLFLSATNFSQIFGELVKQSIGEGSADFTMNLYAKDSAKVQEYLDGANIDGYYGEDIEFAYLKDSGILTGKAKENFDAGKNGTEILLYFMDNASFDAYAKSLGEDPASYHVKGSVKAILYDCVGEYLNRKLQKTNAFNSDTTGKQITVCLSQYDEQLREYVAGTAVTITAGKLTRKDYDSFLFMLKYELRPAFILPFDALAEVLPQDPVVTYGVFARDYETEKNKLEERFSGEGMFLNIQENAAELQQLNALIRIVKVFIYGFITLITLIAIINIINSIANSMNERRTEFAMLKSVGVTPKGFKKMIYVECARYGIHALLWSLPVSALLHYLMYRSLVMVETLDIPFKIYWVYDIAAIVAVFAVILLSLIYSADKIKSRTIIEDLKSD